MSFFAFSTLILINMIDIVGFINVVVMIRVFDMIVIIDFFAENVVLINDLNFFSYSARWMLFNFRKYFLTSYNSWKLSYIF